LAQVDDGGLWCGKAETLDRTSGRLGAVFPQEGQAKKRLFGLEFSIQVCGVQEWGRVGEERHGEISLSIQDQVLIRKAEDRKMS
jgi:hypothetical protein